MINKTTISVPCLELNISSSSSLAFYVLLEITYLTQVIKYRQKYIIFDCFFAKQFSVRISNALYGRAGTTVTFTVTFCNKKWSCRSASFNVSFIISDYCKISELC